MIKKSVTDVFFEFSEPLEGVIEWPYLDTKFLVTVGLGHLCHDLKAFLALPWVDVRTGEPAAKYDVARAYGAVTGATHMAIRGGGHPAWGAVTTMRLRLEDIHTLAEQRMRAFAIVIDGRIGGKFADLPADAQLALISWAWGVGPHSNYPRMLAHAERGEYESAAKEIDMHPKRGTILLRNARNRALMRAAATSTAPDEITCDWRAVKPDKRSP